MQILQFKVSGILVCMATLINNYAPSRVLRLSDKLLLSMPAVTIC